MFCGNQASGYSVANGTLDNMCFVEAIGIIPHVLFLIAALPILLLGYGTVNINHSSWLHYPGHSLRWSLTVLLLFFLSCEIAEGLLSDMHSTASYLQLYIPSGVTFVATLVTAVYYHNVEMSNFPKLLLLLLGYWVIAIIMRILKLWNLYVQGLNALHLRLDLNWLIVAIYFLYICIEINFLVQKRYAFFKPPSKGLDIPEDLQQQDMHFHQPYVNLLSKVTYWWMNKLMVQGYRQPISMDNLGQLPMQHKAQANLERFKNVYKKEKERAAKAGQTPSIWKCFFKAFGVPIVYSSIFRYLGDLLGFIGPLCVAGIVKFLEHYFVSLEEFMENGFILAYLLFMATLLQHTFLEMSYYLAIKEGINLKAGIVGLVYEKTLRMSSWSLSNGDWSIEQIINLMSVDANQIMLFVWFCPHLWAMPVQVVIAMVMLYYQMGYPAVIGAAIIVVLCPVQYLVARQMTHMQKDTMDYSEDRFKKFNEMLKGIRLLKLYSWEGIFCKLVDRARNREISSMRKSSIYLVISLFLTAATPIIATVVTFSIHHYMSDEALTAGRTFATLVLFNILVVPLFNFPMVVVAMVNAIMSAKRLRPFLDIPEVDRGFYLTGEDEHEDAQDVLITLLRMSGIHMKSIKRQKSGKMVPDNFVLEVTNGHFAWDLSSDAPTTTLYDINFKVPRGALTLVIGPNAGGKTSLVNAILGEMKLLAGDVAWCLEKNKVSFHAQKGWLFNARLRDNIVFGQPFNQARYDRVISACSLQADIDILPQGDQTEIGERGIWLTPGQKRRVSVARAIYYSSDIVILDDPLSFLDVHEGSHMMQEGILGMLREENRTVILVTHKLEYLKEADNILVMRDGHVTHQGTFSEITTEDPSLYQMWKNTISSQAQQEEEERRKDQRGLEKKYLRRQATKTHHKEEEDLSDEEKKALTEDEWHYYIYGYVGLSLSGIFLAFLASVIIVLAGVQAGKNLHKKMLRRIILAPMRWFDTTPYGRILSRFSSDTATIDQQLPTTAESLIRTFLLCVAALLVNAIVTPYFLIPAAVILLGFYLLQKFFIQSSRELQHLDILTKSPILYHFSETLRGLSTVRAYRDEKRFQQKLNDQIDQNTLAFLFLNTANRWLGVRLDYLGAFVVLWAAMCSLAVAVYSDLPVGLVGLALTYALMVSTYLNWGVRNIADIEMQMDAVHMVSTFSEMPIEPYRKAEGNVEPHREWPGRGEIVLEHLSTRYAPDLPAVLKEVDLRIKPGENVGICGKTGSGKSSLSMALFRMIDNFQGKIVIDGIDISDVPLSTLRSRLTIIPQDPILFSGTIRFNLDPAGQYNDKELWDAVEIAQLKPLVVSFPEGLDTAVREGGSNFSIGQRQLFCLARAFVRKSRVLVMDEATALVDMETEAVLHRVVKTAFTSCTVITIAHRVENILECDRVLVFGGGRIVENNKPSVLLQQEDSIFSSLVKANL
ncbi:PREDICTED: ATP-binding cassette sub-family C member 8-like [Branchiostoma belcheri]|uniref:ATP-binding cassette sub-family C member 8-like n=1 Tax=Branchiostoma belcheri TaxID=7741 RepID=A0A6P4XXC7_BRABE|nr:PREDICTED: ATP-binding cassette sub-family C member 8-like [Branchiostoma belcheri]